MRLFNNLKILLVTKLVDTRSLANRKKRMTQKKGNEAAVGYITIISTLYNMFLLFFRTMYVQIWFQL